MVLREIRGLLFLVFSAHETNRNIILKQWRLYL